MSRSSRGPPARFTFESGGYRYSVHRHLVTHPHYDTLLLASREYAQGGPVKLVELKPVVLEEGREGLERVLEEVRLARFLRHPNIAAVYGYAVRNEVPHIVMEHLRGCYLLTAMDAAVAVGRRLSPAFAAYVAAEVADALDYAHRREGEDRKLPSLPTLLRLCRALAVDANPLLGFSSSTPPAWLALEFPGEDEPPAVRRLLRTVRKLKPHQLAVLSHVASALLPSPGTRAPHKTKRAS